MMPVEESGRRFYRGTGTAKGAEMLNRLGLTQAGDFGGCRGPQCFNPPLTRPFTSPATAARRPFLMSCRSGWSTMRAHPYCGLKLFGYTAQAMCDEVENSEVVRTMPVALGQAELRGSLRGFRFVGRMGKSAVKTQIIQEGQGREVLSDALMQPRELSLQIGVDDGRRGAFSLSHQRGDRCRIWSQFFQKHCDESYPLE